MKLFMVFVGGHIADSTIEVHDVMFIVSDTFENTFKEVKRRWYGNPDSLHIDSYKVLENIDGYKLVIGARNDMKLYMVNYGGINPDEMSEIHVNTFFVTDGDPKEVAKKQMSQYKFMDHIDTITDIEKYCGESIGFLKGDYSYVAKPDWQGYIKLKEI